MLVNFYQFVHNSLGIHFWDLPTLVIAAILIVVLVVHSYNQKKRENNFEEEREKKLEEMQNELNQDSVQV